MVLAAYSTDGRWKEFEAVDMLSGKKLFPPYNLSQALERRLTCAAISMEFLGTVVFCMVTVNREASGLVRSQTRYQTT